MCLAGLCLPPGSAPCVWGEGPKPPWSPADRRSPPGKGDSVRLFPWDAGVKPSLAATSRTAKRGSGDSLHLLVSALGQDRENAAARRVYAA